MNNMTWQRIPFLPIALAAFMALTRFNHFGSAFSLPDASIAMFFLAGLACDKRFFFLLLLVEAGFIDYLAISQFNVSDYCISPAYAFLIPTYGVMWFAGHFCRPYLPLHFAESTKMIGSATVATSAAFLISNASFYVSSDQVKNGNWGHFLGQFAHYFPAYFSSTLIYIVIALAVVKLRQLMKGFGLVES